MKRRWNRFLVRWIPHSLIRSSRRIKQMLIKDFLQIFRDPRMRSILFVVPVSQSLIFGYAVTTDVQNIPISLVDLDNTSASRKLMESFKHSEYFNVASEGRSMRDVDPLLDQGIISAVVRVDHGFSETISAGETADVQAVIDGTDSNTANIIQGYLERAVSQASAQIFARRIQEEGGGGRESAWVELRSRAWFNEDLKSRNYYVPGVVATLLTLVTLTLTSMSIVREKEIGTMEQIVVSPIKPIEFILGKTCPFIIMGFLNVTAILCVAVFWFEVPFRGSLLLLMGCSGLYLVAILGLGLFISTISLTQQQAMMSAFIFYFPIILLSGFLFPTANMPVAIQWLTYLNPLRYFLIIIRGIFLKGIGVEVLWPQIFLLAAMGAAIIRFSSRRFKKQLS